MKTTKVTKKAVVKKPVKKVVKKAVVKKTVKTAAKKVTKKTVSKKPLVYANNSVSFWMTNGQILNSLIALRDALDEMEKEVYLYHTNKASNDFANWVSAVLKDVECAKALEKAKTPSSAKSVVVKHLKSYTI